MARFSYVLGQGAGKSYIWWTGFILFSSIICYFFGVFVLRIQEFFFFFSFFPEVNYKSQEISFFFFGGGREEALKTGFCSFVIILDVLLSPSVYLRRYYSLSFLLGRMDHHHIVVSFPSISSDQQKKKKAKNERWKEMKKTEGGGRYSRRWSTGSPRSIRFSNTSLPTLRLFFLLFSQKPQHHRGPKKSFKGLTPASRTTKNKKGKGIFFFLVVSDRRQFFYSYTNKASILAHTYLNPYLGHGSLLLHSS